MLCFSASSMKKDMKYSHLGTATLVQLPRYLRFQIWYEFNTYLHHETQERETDNR